MQIRGEGSRVVNSRPIRGWGSGRLGRFFLFGEEGAGKCHLSFRDDSDEQNEDGCYQFESMRFAWAHGPAPTSEAISNDRNRA